MRNFVCAFAVILSASFLIPGGADDFRMDSLLGRAIVDGESPHMPVTEYGGTADVIAFRTPIALGLSIPFSFIPNLHVASALFVALTGAAFVQAMGLRWWWSALILVWPFSEVDKHGKWTFLIGALLIGVAVIRDPKWAGLLLALAVGINLWPGLVAAGLVVSGRWRTAVWSGVWFVGLSLAMLPTSVSIEGTIAGLTQDATYNPANLTIVGHAPWYVLPLGVALFVWWAWGKPWQRVWRWSIPVGLVLSPVIWPAYLPVLAVTAAPREGLRSRSGRQDRELDRLDTVIVER